MGRTIVERLLHNVDDKIVTMRRVCIAQRARGNLKGGTDLHHLRKRTAARRIPRSWPVERQSNWTVATLRDGVTLTASTNL
jgi:hypothetical protein